MNAISSAPSMKLTGTRTTPSFAVAKASTAYCQELCDSSASRSPLARPRSASACAVRFTAASNSAKRDPPVAGDDGELVRVAARGAAQQVADGVLPGAGDRRGGVGGEGRHGRIMPDVRRAFEREQRGRGSVVLGDVADAGEPDTGQQGQRPGVRLCDGGVHPRQPEPLEPVGDERSRDLGTQATPPRGGDERVDDLVPAGHLGRLDLGVPDHPLALPHRPDVEAALRVHVEDPVEQGPDAGLGHRPVPHPARDAGVAQHADERVLVLGEVRVEPQARGPQRRAHGRGPQRRARAGR